MAKYVVERSYLVRKVETWEFEAEADADALEAWRIGDFGSFDESVCSQGELVGESVEFIDDDDLEVSIEWGTEIAR